jgi:hypothetical protein
MPTRKRNDKFTAIREIWDMFIAKCEMYYTSSLHCTIDEQLLGFFRNCPFRTYIEKKTDKYEMKTMALRDGK